MTPEQAAIEVKRLRKLARRYYRMGKAAEYIALHFLGFGCGLFLVTLAEHCGLIR